MYNVLQASPMHWADENGEAKHLLAATVTANRNGTNSNPTVVAELEAQ